MEFNELREVPHVQAKSPESRGAARVERARPTTMLQNVLSSATAGVVIAAALGVSGVWFTARESKGTALIQLSVSILNQPADSAHRPLRSWALDLLNHYSPVKMTDPTRESVLNSVTIPVATLRDPNGNIVPGVPVTWQSSDSDVAAITERGAIQARRPGTAIITGCVTGGICDRVTVRVDSARSSAAKKK
jgi:hypothetical protein